MSAPLPPEAIPAEIRGPGDGLYQALKAANAASRDPNISKKALDAYLLNRYGMTKAALTAAVKAMPKEIATTKPLTTKMILKAQAYGLTGGWSDEIQGLIGALKGTGYAKARKEALEEMRQFEKDFPWLARAAKAYGLGAGALTGGLAARAGIALGAGRGVSAATLGGSMAPRLGAAGRALTGAAVGANAGAGGMLGEDGSRMQNAAAGALAGGAAGLSTGMPVPSNPVGKLLPWIGGAAAGEVGRNLLDFLSTRK